MTLIATCTAVDGSGVCTVPVSYIDAYLLPPDSAIQLGLLLAGDFSVDAAELGFLAVVTLFITGLSVGWIVNMLRKLKTP